MWRPLAYLPQEPTELLVDLLVTLRQPVPVHHSALPHVGQGGELVQVTALGLQLGEHLVQPLHLHDLLTQAAEAQAIGDGFVYAFRTRLDDGLCPGASLGA